MKDVTVKRMYDAKPACPGGDEFVEKGRSSSNCTCLCRVSVNDVGFEATDLTKDLDERDRVFW